MPEKVRRIRNDALLSSGMSSAVERRRLKKQEELHEKRQGEKAAMRASLTKQGETIVDWLDAELRDVTDLSKLAIDIDFDAMLKQIPLAQKLNLSNAELLQAQMVGRLMHIEFLKRARTKAKKLMREAPAKPGESLEFGDE